MVNIIIAKAYACCLYRNDIVLEGMIYGLEEFNSR